MAIEQRRCWGLLLLGKRRGQIEETRKVREETE
jgi:hypothetical protein